MKAICELRRAANEVAVADLEARLAESTDAQELLQNHHTVGQLAAYQGSMDRAIEHFEAAYRIADDNDVTDFKPALQEKLGVAPFASG